MASFAENIIFFKSSRTEETSPRDEIITGIKDIRDRLNTAYSVFNNVTDSKLIEASIYEIKALQAKYTYFLRKAREEGIQYSTHTEDDK